MVEWGRLKILVSSFDPRTVCAICFDPVTDHLHIGESQAKTLSCHHSFHPHCIDGWEKAQMGKGIAPTCPECRAEIEGVDMEQIAINYVEKPKDKGA